MVIVVRQISLKFLYNQVDSKIREVKATTSLAIAFALAESTSKKRSVTCFSFVTLPFWSVQISDSQSILLNAIGDTAHSFETTENTALSSVRRILSTETTEVKAIPSAVDKVLPLFGKVEKSVQYFKNLEDPETISRLGEYFVEVEIGAKVNRIEQKIDSQDALAISEQFQSLITGADTRLGNMDELRGIVQEHLKNQLETLENVLKSERERWERRARTQEEIEELEISELEEKKKDEQYRLEEKYKLDLRALTAKFGRDTLEIESFFTAIIGRIKEVREEIGQKSENVEGAIKSFKDLATELEERIPRYSESVDAVIEIADEILAAVRELGDAIAEESKKVSRAYDSQIRDKKHRLVEFNMERNQAEIELEDLRGKVVTAVKATEREVEKRVSELQVEKNEIMVYVFDNELIPNLAPLTQIDIEILGVLYDNKEIEFYSPGFLPDDRFDIPLEHKNVSLEFNEYLQNLLGNLLENSQAFELALKTRINEGNLFNEGDAITMFNVGLQDLQLRQLLNEGVKERLLSLWEKYRENNM